MANKINYSANLEEISKQAKFIKLLPLLFS